MNAIVCNHDHVCTKTLKDVFLKRSHSTQKIPRTLNRQHFTHQTILIQKFCIYIFNAEWLNINYSSPSINISVCRYESVYTQQTSKYSPSLTYFIYKISTFMYLAVMVTDFNLTFKLIRTIHWPWSQVAIRDVDLC